MKVTFCKVKKVFKLGIELDTDGQLLALVNALRMRALQSTVCQDIWNFLTAELRFGDHAANVPPSTAEALHLVEGESEVWLIIDYMQEGCYERMYRVIQGRTEALKAAKLLGFETISGVGPIDKVGWLQRHQGPGIDLGLVRLT